ncbi:MAG TPA: DUF3180 domain-containing protein [Gryllotalpicola sp.]
MKRTHPTTLIMVGLIGTVVGLLTDAALTATGHAVVVVPITLAVTLVAIGAVVVVMAWPIRRAIRGTAPLRIDPFRAARTAVLAKACSVIGALLAGLPLGLLFYMLTRTVLGDAGNLWQTVSAVVAGALLMTAGLIAEWFCTLPPPSSGEEDEEDRGPEPGATHSHA